MRSVMTADSRGLQARSQRRGVTPLVIGQEPLGPEFGEVPHHPGAQELGVELGDAVDV